VLGFGCGYETSEKNSGAAIGRSIERALANAQVVAGDVGHVNANGDGTIEQDALEAQAIQALLGNTPVTAPKSYFGYLGAGSGIVEMASSVLAFQHQQIPFTLNYQRPDPECPVNVIHGQAEPLTRSVALVMNQSHTGQAVATVLAAP
jgi:3-oxoacyl-[acyl-carrier-protein] synthase II